MQQSPRLIQILTSLKKAHTSNVSSEHICYKWFYCYLYSYSSCSVKSKEKEVMELKTLDKYKQFTFKVYLQLGLTEHKVIHTSFPRLCDTQYITP